MPLENTRRVFGERGKSAARDGLEYNFKASLREGENAALQAVNLGVDVTSELRGRLRSASAMTVRS